MGERELDIVNVDLVGGETDVVAALVAGIEGVSGLLVELRGGLSGKGLLVL